jgi:hypothetical protein
MAIVKTKYIGGRNSKARIKAHVRYIVHRPGKDGEKSSREFFTDDYEKTDKLLTYELIDNAPQNSTFFKFIISPDPKREDTYKDLDLRSLTNIVMIQFKDLAGEKLAPEIQFVAVQHSDHTPNRHIHAIASVPGKLGKEQFQALPKTLRDTATAVALAQREERDLVYAQQQKMQKRGVRHFLFPVDGEPGLFEKERTIATRICARCGGHMSMDGFCFSCGLDLEQPQEQHVVLTIFSSSNA